MQINQWDYLIFALMTVLLLLVAHFILPRLRRRRLMPVEVCVFCLVVLGIGWFTVKDAGEAEQRQVEAEMSSFMPAFAHELGPLVTAYRNLPSKSTLDAIQLAQQAVHYANPEIIGTSLYQRKADGSFAMIPGSFIGDAAQIDSTAVAESAGLAQATSGAVTFQASCGDEKNLHGWAPIPGQPAQLRGLLHLEYSSIHLCERVKKARLAWILGLAMIMLIGGGAIFMIRILRDDLAALRVAESKLRYSEERLWLHFHQAPLAIVENLPDGTISGWNPAAERIFGYGAAEVVGKNSDFIVTPTERAEVRKLLSDIVQDRESRHHINSNLAKDGRSLRCEWHNTPLINAEGEVIGITSIVQDITERLRLEEDLRLSQRIQSVGQLAAGIAHDYNNLLTIIQGRSDLILDRGDLSARSSADLKQISDAAERAAELTRQLLTFGRRQVMLRTPQNANEIFSSVASLLRKDLDQKISLKCDFTPGMPLLNADRGMLTQAMMNLARNAIESMPTGGELRFKTGLVQTNAQNVPPLMKDGTGWAIQLQVSDTGTGMDPTKVTRIFEPFFTTKEVGQGPGLGLPVVHGIVQEHDGIIEVLSHVGKGTVVNIFLPSPAPAEPENLTFA